MGIRHAAAAEVIARAAPAGIPRVLAVASHPIQYQVPWFRALAQSPEIDFSVLYIQIPDAREQGRGFGVAFEWDIPLLEGYQWSRAPHLRGRGGLSGFFAARVADARGLLASLRPDVVLITGWHAWPMLQLWRCARALGIPVIVRGESNALRRRSPAAKAFHRWLLAQADAFLPIGRANRDFYRGYGIEPERLFDAPYFVDNARFEAGALAARASSTALREQWKIPHDVVCYCYAGKLEPKKRILDLLEALRRAIASGARMHLLVVGTGELMPAATAFAARNALPVSFAGFLNQTQIPAAYAAADALVLPSDFGETWGLVVNEAMACGLPAIVSDRVGCGPDLVEPAVTGDVFPFGDTAALAQRLVHWSARPGDLLRMGRRARERVLSGYSIERSVEGTLAAVRYVRALA